MREGEVVNPGPGEEVRCIRSGQDGGPFIFDMELGAGRKGPPAHSHEEGDETIEVTSGEIVFRVNGQDHHLRAGDTLTLTPDDVHTFWNPSKTEPVVCRVTHGPRFERAIAQPSFPAFAIYLTRVDPGASRVDSPFVRLLLRVVATVGRIAGVRPVLEGDP